MSIRFVFIADLSVQNYQW